MTPTEIAAYIGAAVWLPQIATWIYRKSGDDLPALYRKAAKRLNIAPEQHTEDVFKQILGGLISVVNGFAALRNRYGDSHGKEKKYVRPSERHAKLAVNLAGALATFTLETFEKRLQEESTQAAGFYLSWIARSCGDERTAALFRSRGGCLYSYSPARVPVTVNATMTMLYWQIGRRINQEVLKEQRAEYGRQIVVLLARQLGTEYGRGSEQKAIASLSPLLFFQGRGCIKNNRQKSLERTEALLW